MPRRHRIQLPGLPLHLVQRGVNREPCFFAEEDYHCYLHWLKKSAADYHCALHAYVLMTNHVHLLVTPETPEGPSRLMQSVGRRYVQYINRTYKRTGTLWEGRIKSSVVQEAHYFLLCSRYIELNSVRAGMVADVALGASGQDRIAHYRSLFRPQLDKEALPDIRLALSHGQPLGDSRFREAQCKAVGGRQTQARRGRPTKSISDAIGIDGEQTGFGF
ncbi:MAG: transposase [Hydrogenophilales bacterium]|nr:transposase [Hydrogenophilales bacterium]